MINVNVKSYLLLERSIGDSHGEFTKYSSYYENRNNRRKKLNIKYYISRLIIYFLSCSNLDLPSYILLEVNYVFFKDIHVRIRLFFVVVIILFLVVIGKVIYIQVFEYDKLSNLSSELWSRNLPIEGSRGLIYDRNGVVLADNVTTTSLVLIPNQITDKKKVTKELASILNVTEEEMKKHVNKKTSIERVHPEGRRLSFEVADKIAALNLDGVYLVKESKRNYPYDTNLSHVLGYVGIDNQGLSGLELQYDKYLTGEYGSIKYYSDAKGNKLKLSEIYEQPQDGMNITLTINNDIQLAIERELDNAVSKYNPEHALAIAMDPNTGEILGMSSRPNFSPSNYQNYSTEEINRNLPIWMNYEPGSTFNIVPPESDT